MARNRGKRLERLLDFVHEIYRNRGEADITKIELRTKVDRRTGRMIYLARTNFDYSGVIRGGRAIGVEAKETAGQTRLYIDPMGKTGLKIHQIEGLIRWGKLGAIAGVIWLVDWDEAYWIGHKFLEWFMKEIYDKPEKPGGKPIKSIHLDIVKKFCWSIMKDGILDYIPASRADQIDPRDSTLPGGQQCLIAPPK